jgi:hypothetical protein
VVNKVPKKSKGFLLLKAAPRGGFIGLSKGAIPLLPLNDDAIAPATSEGPPNPPKAPIPKVPLIAPDTDPVAVSRTSPIVPPIPKAIITYNPKSYILLLFQE